MRPNRLDLLGYAAFILILGGLAVLVSALLGMSWDSCWRLAFSILMMFMGAAGYHRYLRGRDYDDGRKILSFGPDRKILTIKSPRAKILDRD